MRLVSGILTSFVKWNTRRQNRKNICECITPCLSVMCMCTRSWCKMCFFLWAQSKVMKATVLWHEIRVYETARACIWKPVPWGVLRANLWEPPCSEPIRRYIHLSGIFSLEDERRSEEGGGGRPGQRGTAVSPWRRMGGQLRQHHPLHGLGGGQQIVLDSSGTISFSLILAGNMGFDF